jgi:hypothetical protein
VLKTLGGGTQYINKTDPTTGETTQVPIQQSRGQLGKSILAGAIAGMFGGMGARDAEGRHDPMKAAQEGFQAGQKPMQDKVAQLQKTADEDTSRRQMVMKNNMDLMHQQMAMTHMQHSELQETADNNNKGILADAAAYDKNLSGLDVNDKTKQAVQGRGLTYTDALAKLNGHWSDTMAIVDGYQDTRNPQTGQMETEPTYAVLNPNVSIRMSEQQAAALAKFKPAYQNAYQSSGGNLKIPLQRAVADVHQLNSLNQTEAFFENAKDELGLKSAPDFSAIARKGGQPILDAVKDVENSIAQGGTPIDALNRLAGTGGGAQILKEMGVTNAQVSTLFNKQKSDAALAAQGGQGERAPGAQPQIAALNHSIDTNPDLSESDRAALKVDIPTPDKDGNIHMTQGQIEKLTARQDAAVATNKNLAEKNALANGDPTAMQNTAHDVIGYGSIDSITHITSMRGNARQNAQHAIEKQANDLGLNPAHFSQSAMDAKGQTVVKYSGAGPVGAQLNSFATFGEHIAGAYEANEAWKRSGSPDLNNSISWWAQHASNNQDYQRFRDSVIAPAKEYMSFLNQNRAEHVEDIKALQPILGSIESPNATRESIYTALQTFAKTADDRAWALGNTYVGTVGTTNPNIISKNTVDSFARLGVKSRAQDVSGELPRAQSWTTNLQPQTLAKTNPQDAAIAKRFYAAAGGDMIRMKEMALEHGYVINVQ